MIQVLRKYQLPSTFPSLPLSCGEPKKSGGPGVRIGRTLFLVPGLKAGTRNVEGHGPVVKTGAGLAGGAVGGFR